jgi:C4-dicarboxylate-specific signal transduction histidine kinase
LGRLVGGVAHELNNPLTSIATLAELLATDGHASVAPDAALILRETQRAARIVERLQAFARQRAPERGATDVNRALLDALDLRRHALRADETDIVVDLDYEIPPAWADAHQLGEVFRELVAVAEDGLRTLDAGRVLTLRTRRVGDTVAVTVAHPGMAIAGAIETVLAPFTIVGEIVREHGGTIRRLDVEGTALVVELPLVPPPAGV